MTDLTVARFVRVQDQLGGEAPRWRINPRTKHLETRAPLTWTGTRTYTINGAPVRVLRRWEQIGSSGHKETLRRLGATRGHPSGDRDLDPTNTRDLVVGWTGDKIDDELFDGYWAPVSSCSVFDPECIALMTREQDPLTQTSLGYNALWWTPNPSEIVSEGPNGPVGQWMGPNGPEFYDCEHIVDPACEIVLRLQRDVGFDPRRLGANHFAIAIEQGRGGDRSELLRVVDSLDIPLGRNPVSVPFSLPNRPAPAPAMMTQDLPLSVAPARDASWTVGTDRDLPIVDGPAWDGDAAAASVFAWAGFDGDEPDPDPAKARRAFLAYDSSEPNLKGSYKLPIARYEGGRLEVLASGLQAAASYLPQTDIPADVVERARGVLDGYFAKLNEKRGRDAARPHTLTCRDAVAVHLPEGPRTMTTTPNTIVEQIPLGVGRDNAEKLRKRGITVPATFALRVADMDADKVRSAVEEMQAQIANLLVMLGEAEEKAEDMSEQGAENEKLGGEIAALKAKLAEMEDAYGKMAKMVDGDMKAEDMKAEKTEDVKQTLDTLVTEVDKLRKERDSLRVEVEPLRAEAFARARDVAEKIGVDKDKLGKAETLADVKRLAVVHKLGNARFGKANDDAISGAFVGIELAVAEQPAATQTNDAAQNSAQLPGATPAQVPAPASNFDMPAPTLPTRDSANSNPGAAPTATATLKNNLAALG